MPIRGERGCRGGSTHSGGLSDLSEAERPDSDTDEDITPLSEREALRPHLYIVSGA